MSRAGDKGGEKRGGGRATAGAQKARVKQTGTEHNGPGKASSGKAAPGKAEPGKPGARRSAGKAGASRSRRTPAYRAVRGRPSRADILAVVVLGLSVLAACSSQLDKGRSGSGSGAEGTAAVPAGEVSVQFLDVGQGDSVLVRSPEGKTLLVDGGRSAERMRELLAQYEVDKVDLMIASHADADHIAGLVEAAKTTRPTLFINNGLAGTTQTWARLVAALEAAGTGFQKANNQIVNLGSVKVRVIAPPAGMGDDQNENSVGVRIEFGGFSALLTGDSETRETDAWLAENRAEIRGPVQVYKSIHHGAANGDNAGWLAAVQPENVVISVGDNSYGHPTKQALDLYAARGVRVYRTDRQGTVTFRGQGDGTYAATTER